MKYLENNFTQTLSITRPDPGLDKVYCAVSHPTAQPGIVNYNRAKLRCCFCKNIYYMGKNWKWY